MRARHIRRVACPFALVLLFASVGTNADISNPIGKGLNYLATPTNCLIQSEQAVENIPAADEWARSRVPVFGPNTGKLYAWTNTEIDNAYLFSSKPALVHVPTALSLPTGGTYNNRSETTYQIDEPAQPTEVIIRASSAMHHLTSADIERKIMVYPRQFIQGFSLKPQKSAYQIGDQVTAVIALKWSPGMVTVQGVFDAPTIGGNAVIMSPWTATSTSTEVYQPTKDPEVPLTFTIALSDQVLAAQNGATNISVKLKARIQDLGSCQLVKDPSSSELTFVVTNPNAGQCPAGSSRVTSHTQLCSNCIPNDTTKVRQGSCPAGTVYENGYCLTCAAAAPAPPRVVAPKPKGPAVNDTLPGAPTPGPRVVTPPKPGPVPPEH